MSNIQRTAIKLFILILLAGCSSAGDSGSPAAPPVQNPQNLSILQDGTQSSHNLWFYGYIVIDPSNPDDVSFEVINLRNAASHWNILNWLENFSCTDCFQIVPPIVPGPDDTFLIDIKLSHPFDSPNLTGFDVRGIAMFNGSVQFPEAVLYYSDRNLGDGQLMDPDGYTTLYNPTTEGNGFLGTEGYIPGKLAGYLPTGLLNGYKRYISDDPSNTRNAFLSGDSITGTYTVAIPDGPFFFGYAVDSSWIFADNIPVTDPMNDFPPEANCPEAWKIDVTEEPVGGGLTSAGGQTKLTIDVYDHQGKDDTNPVKLEAPDLFSGEITATWIEDFTDFTRYEAVISNSEFAQAGTYTVLISHEAVENDPDSKPWLDLTAYQVTTVDVSQAVNIFNLEDVTPGYLEYTYSTDMEIIGDYLYVGACNGGFHIFDISDMSAPIWVNWLDYYTPTVQIWDKYVFLYDETEGVYIFDISNPHSLSQVNFIPTDLEVQVIAASDGYLFVETATYNEGSEDLLFDVHIPESPVLMDTYDKTGSAVIIEDGLLFNYTYDWYNHIKAISVCDFVPPEIDIIKKFISDGMTQFGGYDYEDGLFAYADGYDGLELYDMTDPETSELITTVDNQYYHSNIILDGGYAYLSRGSAPEPDTCYAIFDVDPPGEAAVVSVFGSDSGVSIAASGGRVAYDNTSGLVLYNAADPYLPFEAGRYSTVGQGRVVRVDGDYLFVADRYYMLAYDISDPENIVFVGAVKCPDYSSNGGDMEIQDGFAYVSISTSDPGSGTSSENVWSIDVDPPDQMHTVGTWEAPPTWIESFDTQGDYLYLANRDTGLHVIDISDPASLNEVANCPTPGSVWDVDVSGDYAYVADYATDGTAGLQIINISDPLAPFIEKEVNLPVDSPAYQVTSSNAYAYVISHQESDEGDRFHVIDVDPIDSASIVRIFESDYKLLDIDIQGDYAYVSNEGDCGFEIFDISDPANAFITGKWEGEFATYSLDVIGNYLYLGTYLTGLRVIRLW